MKSLIRLVLGLSLAVLTVIGAVAENYKFSSGNKTTKYTITGYQTVEHGTWSTRTGVSLAPGEEATIGWGANEGKCVVPFRVIYSEIETEQYQVDWCKVTNIIVSDTDVTYN